MKISLKASLIPALLLSALSLPNYSVFAENDKKDLDSRINLHFTEEETVEFLSEMRQMLASIQGIMEGIGTENRALIIKSARYSGNRMARETPDSIKDKTPANFKSIGGPTHLMFEEIVIRAEDDDMDTIAELTSVLMKNCLACHATYKVN